MTACWAAAAAGPAGGAAPVTVPATFISPPFPFRALNSVEQGSSVGMGQTPARCCDLCLWSSQAGSTLSADILLVCQDSALVQG